MFSNILRRLLKQFMLSFFFLFLFFLFSFCNSRSSSHNFSLISWLMGYGQFHSSLSSLILISCSFVSLPECYIASNVQINNSSVMRKQPLGLFAGSFLGREGIRHVLCVPKTEKKKWTVCHRSLAIGQIE